LKTFIKDSTRKKFQGGWMEKAQKESGKGTKDETWSSSLGFILVSIGSAVGIGNIWRFPYLAGQNGGAAFLIPYLLSVLIFGIPLMLLEFAAGRRFRSSLLGTFERIDKRVKWLALVPLLMGAGILSYYVVIAGWTLCYFFLSLTGNFTDFASFSQTNWSFLGALAVIAATAFVLLGGIRSGIERANKLMVAMLFICLIVMVFEALSLPGASKGIEFYLKPDFSALGKPDVWLIAVSQVIFSLSVGYGIMLTYGGYGRKDENLPRSSAIIAGADTLVAFLGGLMIFPIVFAFGMNPAEGPSLAFSTMPQIFSRMGFGWLFGAIFFLLLFFAALTSSISMLEVYVKLAEEKMGWKRRKAVLLCAGALAIVAIPSALSYTGIGLTIGGKPFLDAMDFAFGTVLAPLSALAMCIGIAWFWKERDFITELNLNTQHMLGSVIVVLLKHVIPLALMLLFLAFVFGRIL